MGTLYPPAVLRIEPSAIPAIRAVLSETLTKLTTHLNAMERDAYLPEPWMGDSVSARVQIFYNEMVMASPTGPYKAAIKYRDELQNVHKTLQDLEDQYRRAEGDNAELWGKLA